MSTNPNDDPELPPPLEIVEPTKERFVDQTPYRFPQAPETTPELRAEYRRRAHQKKKRKRRKRQIRNAVALFAFLTLPVAYVWYTSRPHRVPETIDETRAIPATEFQKLLENGDAAQLIKYSESLENGVLSGILPTQVSALQQRGQIADRLLELGTDEKSTEFAVTTKINGLMTLTGFDILNDFDDTISARLLDFAKLHAGSTKPVIRNRANLGVVASRLHDYIQDSTDHNFDEVKGALTTLLDNLTPDVKINPEVRMILPIMDLSKREDHIREFKSLYGAKLKQSADPELRAFGALVFDETIIGAVNFETLRQDVLVGTQDSIRQLESIVDTISANPIVSTPVFLCTIGVIENLRPIDEKELENQLVAKLQLAIPAIPEDTTREQVSKGLSEYEIRRNLIGKIFDPANNLVSHVNSRNTHTATLIVFFSHKSSSSAKLISSLNEVENIVNMKVPCLLVCIDPSLTSDETEEIKAVFPAGNLIGPPDNADYLAECPILSVPYIVILDGEQKVVDVNVRVDQIRDELAKLSDR